MYRNSTSALIGILKTIQSDSNELTVRENEIREILSQLVVIEKPLERCILLPYRKNNIFAAIAETIWVLAGRNDIGFLKHYLPKADQFSDDGEHWRGGYGPRLRTWHEIDQFKNIVNLLNTDKNSRRAVMVIFDPALDFVDSLDIPCNNWIHFIIRDDILHMNIGIRSNDVIWGFSGINTFEWSYLQEMMAYWTDSTVGKLSYFVGSLHLYKYHFKKAENILGNIRLKTLYDFGVSSPKFSTDFNNFDHVLNEIFNLEQMSREGNNVGIVKNILQLNDDLLRTSMLMLNIHNSIKNEIDLSTLIKLVNDLPDCDFKIMAIEFISRKHKDKNVIDLSGSIKSFFNYYWRHGQKVHTYSFDDICYILSRLHAKKSKVYGDSWKKHGEVISIFANISRKYDRIVSVLGGKSPTSDESISDTFADLAVYCIKYFTFISEKYISSVNKYLKNLAITKNNAAEYQGDDGFENVIDLLSSYYGNHWVKEEIDLYKCLEIITDKYKVLEKLLNSKTPSQKNIQKCDSIVEISIVSIHIIKLISISDPEKFEMYRSFIDKL